MAATAALFDGDVMGSLLSTWGSKDGSVSDDEPNEDDVDSNVENRDDVTEGIDDTSTSTPFEPFFRAVGLTWFRFVERWLVCL